MRILPRGLIQAGGGGSQQRAAGKSEQGSGAGSVLVVWVGGQLSQALVHSRRLGIVQHVQDSGTV